MTDKKTILISLENFMSSQDAQATCRTAKSISQWYENCCDCHGLKTVRATALTKGQDPIPLKNAVHEIIGRYKGSEFIILAAGQKGIEAFKQLQNSKKLRPFHAVLIKTDDQDNVECGFASYKDIGIDLVAQGAVHSHMQSVGMMSL